MGDRPTAADAALRARARAVIPRGMYGHQSAAWLPPGYPQFFSGGDGALVWDADGNEYVDLMCSWGPILLGHRHPRVEAAVRARLDAGDCLDGPTPDLVETAELLVDTVEHAGWAMFAKNGSDATTLAVLIARAATGRRKVLVAEGAYHGAAAWCSPHPGGLTGEDRANTLRYEYNDLASLEAAAARADGDLAAVVACPMRHDLRRDLEPVDAAFARGVRRLCDRTGAALVLDEVRTGLRLAVGGSWEPIGVRPDLSAWSKAIANGHPLACVLGSDVLREAAGGVFATGSFWMSAAPMAAARATIEALREEDGIGAMVAAGERLRAGLAAQSRAHGLDVTLSGPVQMPFMTFASDPGFARAEAWAAAAVARGVYAHPHHNWFLSAALTDALVDRALAATDEAFAAVAAGSSGRP